MITGKEKLKNSLREKDTSESFSGYHSRAENMNQPPESDSMISKFLLAAVIILLGIYFIKDISSYSFNPVSSAVTTIFSNEPSAALLDRMNALMMELGYTDLTHNDLRELRREGVTATYISNIHAIGFTDLTLEEAVRMAGANVSTAFMAMMIELGYNLDIDEYIRLRRAGVTAYYTSNIHDLGYTGVTTDQLIRMRRIGVSTSLIEQLQNEHGQSLPLEEIIRHRISNQ